MAGSIASDDGEIGFQIAPMVDVVFVLILFFMACAGSQVKELELGVTLPSGSTLENIHAPPKLPVFIDISPDGVVSMNSAVYGLANDRSLSALRDFMKTTTAQFGEQTVIVRPSPETRHERIMDVLNVASASGVTHLAFH